MKPSRAAIAAENRHQRERQRLFRAAADAAAFARFDEVVAVAVIGSVAKPLRKEVPRFRDFRRHRVEIWHECKDLDIALWLESQSRLGDLRRRGPRGRRKDARRPSAPPVRSRRRRRHRSSGAKARG